eukprot:COSAG02_NODE_528_length_20698_cov_6.231710_9_plen_72_part_00
MPRQRRARHCCKNPANLLACCSAALLAPVLAGEHTQMLEGVCWQLAGRGDGSTDVTLTATEMTPGEAVNQY